MTSVVVSTNCSLHLFHFAQKWLWLWFSLLDCEQSNWSRENWLIRPIQLLTLPRFVFEVSFTTKLSKHKYFAYCKPHLNVWHSLWNDVFSRVSHIHRLRGESVSVLPWTSLPHEITSRFLLHHETSRVIWKSIMVQLAALTSVKCKLDASSTLSRRHPVIRPICIFINYILFNVFFSWEFIKCC